MAALRGCLGSGFGSGSGICQDFISPKVSLTRPLRVNAADEVTLNAPNGTIKTLLYRAVLKSNQHKTSMPKRLKLCCRNRIYDTGPQTVDGPQPPKRMNFPDESPKPKPKTIKVTFSPEQIKLNKIMARITGTKTIALEETIYFLTRISIDVQI